MKLTTLALLGVSTLAGIATAAKTPSGFTTITTTPPTLTTVAFASPTSTSATANAADVPASPTDESFNVTDSVTSGHDRKADPSYCTEDRGNFWLTWVVQIENFGHTKLCGDGYFQSFDHESGLITSKWSSVSPDDGVLRMYFDTMISCGQDHMERATRRASGRKIRPLCYKCDKNGNYPDR